ncbi:MAG: alpha amylase C-terminal domain-containing protein [Desulfosarcinaceae bacterium]
MPVTDPLSIPGTRISALVEAQLAADPYLTPYRERIAQRLTRVEETRLRLTGNRIKLTDFAAGHTWFGLQREEKEWVLREWAPNATAIYLVGDFSDWREREALAFSPSGRQDGVWELRLDVGFLAHGMLYRLRIHWPGGSGDRLPAYARRVVQDPDTLIFNAQVWQPAAPYVWRYPNFRRSEEAALIYETHVGMAQSEGKIGTYDEFREVVLPRVAAAGYNTIQLMAIQEHPYYASFGYHVSNFFAASSRFGTPYELKALIDAAHGLGLAVIMDIVHSHAVANEVEGLSRFDGTLYQYFHDLPRGYHEAWDSRLFDYGKTEVLHFLLSNCRFWLDEYRVDGFRFDGITSMLYRHHGLGKAFSGYDYYFDESVEEEALAYLALANRVIHALRPDALTIAEDVSGMPGLALAAEKGGIGFDYRFAMGVPDLWIKLIKEVRDEDWPLGHLWYELINRRAEEATISYTESHDQALVGDKTIAFRLMDAAMYDHMQKNDPDLSVARGIALHKMIRLITLATAGSGYLNFMGNEFGHPEWIDFPREGNGWSYAYARRQWHLADDPGLKYRFLARFDRAMIQLVRETRLLDIPQLYQLWLQQQDLILAFERGNLIFVFNFNGVHSFTDYGIPIAAGRYRLILDSDADRFGGHGRLTAEQIHHTLPVGAHAIPHLSLYLPTRSAIVLKRLDAAEER